MKRLGAVQRHLAAARAGAPRALAPPQVPTAAASAGSGGAPGPGGRPPRPAEALLARFAAEGFVVLDAPALAAQLPAGFHEGCHARASSRFSTVHSLHTRYFRE